MRTRRTAGLVGAPVLALALWVGHFFVGSLALSAADAARIYAAQNHGPRSLLSVEVLAEEPLGGDRVVVFRALNTGLPPAAAGARPTAIAITVRRAGLVWRLIGGAIGTVAPLDQGWAVACAWTWLRYLRDAPTVAAFNCAVEEPRLAVIELERVDGAARRRRPRRGPHRPGTSGARTFSAVPSVASPARRLGRSRKRQSTGHGRPSIGCFATTSPRPHTRRSIR